MPHVVSRDFTLEGVEYEPGQLLGDSFPAGSLKCNERIGLLAEVSDDEAAAMKSADDKAEAARKKPAESKPATAKPKAAKTTK